MTAEKKQTQKHTRKKADIRIGISPLEWVMSITMGVTSGIAAAGATVRDRFIDELPKWPDFKEIFSSHGKKLDSINSEYISRVQSTGKTDWKWLADKIGEQKDLHGETVINELENVHGIRSRGIAGLLKGTWQRYEFAGTYSKGRIAFNTIIGATVGAAATLSFFNGVASRHKIEKIEEATSDIAETIAAAPETATRVATTPAKTTPVTQVAKVVEHEKMAANDPTVAVRA